MQTAFGTALIDSLDGSPRLYQITKLPDATLTLSCEEYLHLRDDEKDVLDALELPADASVLDYGCGIGRHLAYLKKSRPHLKAVGVEHCDQLRQHCVNAFDSTDTFYANIEELPEQSFDAILLMGNGVGILGDEKEAIKRLEFLFAKLNPEGAILLETGNLWGAQHTTPQFTINYNNLTDGPFQWGFASEEWIHDTVMKIDPTASVSIFPSNAHGPFFFAVIKP
jgi:SAM-dependent methyltransferase